MSETPSERPPPGTLHPSCGKRFFGSHCGSCHESFTGGGAFDAHRLGPDSKYPWTCMPAWTLPALGLWLNPKGSWSQGTPEGYAARIERFASVRASRANHKEDDDGQ